MEPRFAYRRIGQPFRKELADLIASGQSAVLISLRDLGKRYALRQLADDLAQDGSALVLEVDFPHEPALLEASAVQSLVLQAAQRAAPDFTIHPDLSGDLFFAVRQLCDRQRRSVVLLASNVDSLAHHLAQLLLRETRVLTGNHRLTAVLTGEENLRDLVHGPESEFNCAHQFVVQGFDETEFLAYMRRRCEVAQMPFADEDTCLRLLFGETGGNILLARAALWAWLELRARTRLPPGEPTDTEPFRGFLAKFPVNDACGMDVFHQMTRVIARASEAWEELKQLRAGQPVAAAHGSKPGTLELAGLALRERDQLRIVSPILHRFAVRYYDACRLGDLHAVHGEWDEAFTFYHEMPVQRRLRPCGAEDLPRLAMVTKAFAAKLNATTTRNGEVSEKKVEELKRLFIQGCQLILGLPEITFWSHEVGSWQPQNGETIEPVVANIARLILAGADLQKSGWQPITAPTSQRGALAILPSIRPDFRNAVVVSDAKGRVAISRERQEVLGEMLNQFASAYDHCIANQGIKKRLEDRNTHIKVATAIVNALGRTVRNPRQALKLAGDELIKLGFRRIMFAMVDPKQRRIRGVSFCCGKPTKKNVAQATDWPLDKWEEDIQPWVVNKKRPCVVKLWPTWNKSQERMSSQLPPVNDVLCLEAKTAHNFAVIPMLLGETGEKPETGEVFGTIHVEREDGLPPSDDEIADLLEFGRQMAAAAHQSELVHALLAALDHDPEAVVIVDEDKCVRFVNQPAALRLDLPKGWHETQPVVRLDPVKHSKVIADFREVLASSKPKVCHVISPPGETPRREVIQYAPLPDWRREDEHPGLDYPAIGAVLQLSDLTPIHRVSLALEQVAKSATDSESIITALLQSVAGLGYPSARLYRIDPQNQDLLVSVRALGLDPENADRFSHGFYRMSQLDPVGVDTWRCLKAREPQIHQWNPERLDGLMDPTEHGLAQRNVQSPGFPQPWKQRGDVWIELPLFANGHPIGKLSIDCGSEGKCMLTSEDFELLRLFSALLGALLDGLYRKEQWIRDAADKAMATCAHNIRTKLAALDGFADNYRAAAPDNSEVETLNRLYQPAVDGSFRQVTRIKDTFVILQLQRSPTKVWRLLDDTLKGKLGVDRQAGRVDWNIDCKATLEFSLDAERLRNALEEIVENSRAMLSPNEKLRLILHAEVELRVGRPWLCLRLQDNGPGIPAEKRDRVFEPFFSERPYGQRSTGMGLNFVRRVVEAHGGQVTVTGEPGKGAVFVIEIPEPPSNA